MGIINEEAVNGFLSIPVFSRLVTGSGYKSVGIRIVDNDKVVQELTSSYVEKRIKLKHGISNPDFVVSIDYNFLKTLDKKRLDWIKANPFDAYLKYHDKVDVPLLVKLKILRMLQGEGFQKSNKNKTPKNAMAK